LTHLTSRLADAAVGIDVGAVVDAGTGCWSVFRTPATYLIYDYYQ